MWNRLIYLLLLLACAVTQNSCESTSQVLDRLVTVNGRPLSTALGEAGLTHQTSTPKQGSKSTANGWVRTQDESAWIYFPHPGKDDYSKNAPPGQFEWTGGVDANQLASGTGTFTWHAGDGIYQYHGTLREGVLNGDFLTRNYPNRRGTVGKTTFENSRRRGGQRVVSTSESVFAKPGSTKRSPESSAEPNQLTPEQEAARLAALRELRAWRNDLSPGDPVKFYQYGLPTTNPLLSIEGGTVYYHWKSFLGESRRSIDISYIFPPEWALTGKIRTATNGFGVVNHPTGQTYSVRVDTDNDALFTDTKAKRDFDDRVKEKDQSSLLKTADQGSAIGHATERAQE